MGEFQRKKPDSRKTTKTRHVSDNRGMPRKFEPIDKLISLFSDKLSSHQLMETCIKFQGAEQKLGVEISKFINSVEQLPFISAFLVWTHNIACELDYVGEAQEILKSRLIPFHDAEGNVFTIAHASRFDHAEVVEAIRCLRNIPLQVREDMVIVYITFIEWINYLTQYHLFTDLEDPDIRRTWWRKLPLSRFCDFIIGIKNENARIVAKLLYFGGNRTLDEILRLEIKDIDYENRQITFGTSKVSYPLHVFSDIKSIAHPRTSGKVFIGRQNAALSPKTIFLNFKSAVKLAGLDPAFSIKTLTADNLSSDFMRF